MDHLTAETVGWLQARIPGLAVAETECGDCVTVMNPATRAHAHLVLTMPGLDGPVRCSVLPGARQRLLDALQSPVYGVP